MGSTGSPDTRPPTTAWIYVLITAVTAAITTGAGLWVASNQRAATVAANTPEPSQLTGVWNFKRTNTKTRCEFRADYTFECQTFFGDNPPLAGLGRYNIIELGPRKILVIFDMASDSRVKPNQQLSAGYELLNANSIRDLKDGTVSHREASPVP